MNKNSEDMEKETSQKKTQWEKKTIKTLKNLLKTLS